MGESSTIRIFISAPPRRARRRIAQAAATSPRSTWSRISACRASSGSSVRSACSYARAAASAVAERLVGAPELEGGQPERRIDVERAAQRGDRGVGVAEAELGQPADEVRVGVERVRARGPFGDVHGALEIAPVGGVQRGGEPGVRRPGSGRARGRRPSGRRSSARRGRARSPPGAGAGASSRASRRAEPHSRSAAPSTSMPSGASARSSESITRSDRLGVEVDQDVAAEDQVERAPRRAAARVADQVVAPELDQPRSGSPTTQPVAVRDEVALAQLPDRACAPSAPP